MLGTRSYTVAEIDALRAVELKWRPTKGVEDRVRTYMLNGSRAEELHSYYLGLQYKAEEKLKFMEQAK